MTENPRNQRERLTWAYDHSFKNRTEYAIQTLVAPIKEKVFMSHVVRTAIGVNIKVNKLIICKHRPKKLLIKRR